MKTAHALYLPAGIHGKQAMGDSSELLERACSGNQSDCEPLFTALCVDFRKLAQRALALPQ